MTYLFLLASGKSTRYGSNKLLSLYNNRELWTYGYDALTAAAIETSSQIYVVSRFSKILKSVGDRGINCPEGSKGLSFTIKKSLKYVGTVSDSDKILFMVADQPHISKDTIVRLINVPLADNFDSNLPLGACVNDGTKDGNPVIFSGLLYKELLELDGDQGGKAVLKKYPDRVYRVSCNQQELIDFDYPI